MRNQRGDILFKLQLLLVVALALALIGYVSVRIYRAVGTHRSETFTVEKSERIAEYKSGRYLIFTDRGVYENTDSFLNGKFNSSDLYNQLKPGNKYTCDTIGWRVGLLSWYPNVLKCEEVRQEASVKPIATVLRAEKPVQTLPGALEAINEYRKAKGLEPLALNAKLNHSAQAKADDLVAKRYWSHTSPDGTQPWTFIEKAGYAYSKAGENLAKCYASPRALVQAWIASPEHEAVLRGNYADVGFGAAKKDNCNYVVGHFGRK